MGTLRFRRDLELPLSSSRSLFAFLSSIAWGLGFMLLGVIQRNPQQSLQSNFLLAFALAFGMSLLGLLPQRWFSPSRFAP
jgi:hypothetical protein